MGTEVPGVKWEWKMQGSGVGRWETKCTEKHSIVAGSVTTRGGHG